MEVNSDLISQLETLTKDGKARQIAEIIDDLVVKKIPRPMMALISQICFRNGLYLQSLKILNPIIRPSVTVNPKPQPNELIAYATTLVSMNMHSEARSVLASVDRNAYPESLLRMAFSYFGEWNYEKTIPLLRKFSAHPGISYYRQIVGKVNLAAAYVTSSHTSKAEELLLELLVITTERDYRLLKGNTLELLAQLEMQKKNYVRALHYLQESKRFIDSTSIYFFFVTKWENICNLLLSPGNPEFVEKCRNLKVEAKKWRHAETARDVDLYIAFATDDNELLQKVVLGTANPSYLKKVEMLFGRKVIPDKTIKLRNLNEKPHNVTSVYYEYIASKLKHSRIQSELFLLLTKDFYRPANLGLLFSNLYPEEQFNPETSEKRVLNQVYSLARVLNQDGPYFTIRKDKMDFIFEVNSGIELVFHRHGHRLHFTPTLKEKLKAFGSGTFTSKQLANHLECSQRKAQLIIKNFVKEGFLSCVNRGAHSSYILSRYHSRSLVSLFPRKNPKSA